MTDNLYKLEDLLKKTGTEGVTKENGFKMVYADGNSKNFTEAKIVKDDESLILHQEVIHLLKTEDGKKELLDEIFISARKVDDNNYQVMRVETEEGRNTNPSIPDIEMALGIFHSRLADTEELIGKRDLIQKAEETLKKISNNDGTLKTTFNNVRVFTPKTEEIITPRRARGIVHQFPGRKVA
ncbi:MAG: hypothetical protein GY793_11950 [Proteobacteria bacterium]|nr:hypothetical protein [Pseudomonadota bacterium]